MENVHDQVQIMYKYTQYGHRTEHCIKYNKINDLNKLKVRTINHLIENIFSKEKLSKHPPQVSQSLIYKDYTRSKATQLNALIAGGQDHSLSVDSKESFLKRLKICVPTFLPHCFSPVLSIPYIKLVRILFILLSDKVSMMSQEVCIFHLSLSSQGMPRIEIHQHIL